MHKGRNFVVSPVGRMVTIRTSQTEGLGSLRDLGKIHSCHMKV